MKIELVKGLWQWHFFFVLIGVVFLAVVLTAMSAESQATKAPPEITINPQRTAVLVLHMMNEQLKYRAGVTGYGPEFAESNKEFRIIENTKAIVDASREKGIQIVYVRMSYREGYPELPMDEEGMPEKVRLRKQGLYKEGSWATEIVDELKPVGNDIVVKNNTPSAFCYNELDIILRNKNIRYLVIAGLSTKTVVLGTTIDANLKGYYNYILEDCCNSRGGRKEHEMVIKEILPAHAVIIDSKRYLQALQKIKK
jgi:nicotinamidase-related amidase